MKDRIECKETYTLIKNDNCHITVRDLQLQVLSIMDEIHRICEKHNIKYALIAGSALGIVNYKGFIPWDDDIDICIERKDWKKFVKALQNDLSSDFYFQCFDTDKRYNVLHWLTILLKNREFDLRSSVSQKAKEYLIKNYSVDNIKYIGNEIAYNNIYYVLKNIRDLTARKYYFDHKHEIESNDIFIMDLIRGINYEI